MRSASTSCARALIETLEGRLFLSATPAAHHAHAHASAHAAAAHHKPAHHQGAAAGIERWSWPRARALREHATSFQQIATFTTSVLALTNQVVP